MTDENNAKSSEDSGKNEEGASDPQTEPVAEQSLREPFPFARLFLTIAFGVVASITFWILVMFALLQFATVAIAGHRNEELQHFSRLTARYLQEVFDYMTLTIDTRPFPLGPFPKE